MSGGLIALRLVLALSAAAGPTLDGALDLYRAGKLSEALAAFESLADRGGLESGEMKEIYLHLGILRAGSRDTSGAERAFYALCSIDFSVEKPKGASPVVAQPFDRAKVRCARDRELEAVRTASVAIPVPAEPPKKPAAQRLQEIPPVVARPPPAPALVAEEERASILESPWFWAATGVAAVGGTALAIFLATRGSGKAHVGGIAVEEGGP